MSLECFIPKDFRMATRVMIRKANSIIDDYQRQGYKLTLRQLFYQFVSRNWIENKQTEYKRLGEILNDARLAGLVPWDAIEDRGRNLVPTPMWDTPAEFIGDWGRFYKQNPWDNQPCYVEAWIEKDSLVGILERPCSKWRVPYFSCRGYVSASEMYDTAKRLAGYAEAGQDVVILHLGDHDPSGTQMTENIDERIALLSHECEGITVKRIALNLDQIRQYNPPPNTAKETDSRFAAYKRRYRTDQSWELDSMPPSVMADLVAKEIEALVDMDLWQRDIAAEQQPRADLLALGRMWASHGSNFRNDVEEAMNDLTFKREGEAEE